MIINQHSESLGIKLNYVLWFLYTTHYAFLFYILPNFFFKHNWVAHDAVTVTVSLIVSFSVFVAVSVTVNTWLGGMGVMMSGPSEVVVEEEIEEEGVGSGGGGGDGDDDDDDEVDEALVGAGGDGVTFDVDTGAVGEDGAEDGVGCTEADAGGVVEEDGCTGGSGDGAKEEVGLANVELFGKEDEGELVGFAGGIGSADDEAVSEAEETADELDTTGSGTADVAGA